ncbi:MAG: putative lipid II flippase FtsW [Woeseia sp.]|nr:putative lipid II flippase FtsW [Woeseia sp.]|tara:strand:+ start:1736 stop:2932 length:1197 start_codon:yes stop_codon:yes gene_type:complete
MIFRSAANPFLISFKAEFRFDFVLLTIVLALIMVGFVILSSASISVSESTANNSFFYLQRQIVAAAIGISGGFICLLIPMKFWLKISPLILGVGFLLLMIVLVPGIGHEVNGSVRWINLGIFNLQVSEPARLCFIIYLAGYLVRRNKSLREEFTGFLRPMIVLSLACALLLSEPDFGATVVLLSTTMVMMFVAGARIRDFLLFIITSMMVLTVVAIASPYRMQRITGFLDPWSDPFNTGFQLTQSLIAIGRGEWFGVGLGDSVQKLFYLPEAHTDFVFAVYAEETGLLGSVLLILLYLALLWRVFRLAMKAANLGRLFESYTVIGIGTWLGIQTFFNIGVNMGLLPTKGLTLPLISYGGSSLIITIICIALLFRIHHELTINKKSTINQRHSKLDNMS